MPEKPWPHLIPEDTPFVILPHQNTTIPELRDSEFADLLDDLTSTPVQQLASLKPGFISQLTVESLLLYPSSRSNLSLVWITEALEAPISDWAPPFYEPFAQNQYQFNTIIIHRLFVDEYVLYGAQVGNWLVFSESTYAIEQSIEAYLSDEPSSFINQPLNPGQVTLHASRLDSWIEQLANVDIRPELLNAFGGLEPSGLTYVATGDSSRPQLNLSGTFRLTESRSILVDAFSSDNTPLILDRYISTNAASFVLFRLPPSLIPAPIETTSISRIDSLLSSDLDAYQAVSNALSNEFGIVTFSKSGLLSTGEYVFLRKVNERQTLVNQFENWLADGLISRTGNSYVVKSSLLAQLIGSEFAPLTDFYASFSGDVLVISKRRGLTESIEADRTRRRVLYYDPGYAQIKRGLPDALSGLVWARSSESLEFLRPFLKQRGLVSSLFSRFDITTISMQVDKADQELTVTLATHEQEGSVLPYRELWVIPLPQLQLTGTPVLENIVGSSAKEILFSNQDGSIYGLANDGTIVFQASTDGERPVGSPILYDWYGNGQPVVLQGAGSKVFAWNTNGTILPQFPIELGERISAPIVVTDVLRNGIPEIIVATERRKLHVLDGRGQNVSGWPQLTNGVITETPVFNQVNNIWSVWALAENSVFGWLRNGSYRPGFPVFTNASFAGSPVFYNDQVLASGTDGYVYSVGTMPIFADTLGLQLTPDSVSIQALYVSNTPLQGIVVEENVLLSDSSRFYRTDLLLTQSRNGAVFGYNPAGQLELTASMGQPASASSLPQIVDINSDRKRELISLAEFGRLFAWEVLSDERLFNLPTSGIRFPVIQDINGDGKQELIAQTREGLRCWTINPPEN
ncbi:MAG: hypothetical protein AAFW89_02315 [Bacteroidota bacterium]